MKNSERSSTSWGRYAVYHLIRTFNCPSAMLQTCQQMIGVVGNPLLAATSGLAAGVAGKGSSCGLVSGGALGIALAYDQHMFAADTDAERAIVKLARGITSNGSKSHMGARTVTNCLMLTSAFQPAYLHTFCLVTECSPA